ncbi:MAG: TlpA disulfide reductase family protein [Acetobacteraceae bacterium]
MSVVFGLSRRSLLAGAAGCCAIASGARQALAGPGELAVRSPRRALEAATFLDVAGAVKRLSDFVGRGLVVNLWATWCPPCVEEMPSLERLAVAVAPDRIEVLALSQDRGGAEVVRSFYARLGIRRLEIWLDPRGAASRAWGARGLPTTLIIDRAGLEAARLEGAAAWDDPAMIGRIRGLVQPVGPSIAAT